MQHDVNQHLVQTGRTFYRYDAAIILTSLLGRGRIFLVGLGICLRVMVHALRAALVMVHALRAALVTQP
jgi:hypothetical protein